MTQFFKNTSQKSPPVPPEPLSKDPFSSFLVSIEEHLKLTNKEAFCLETLKYRYNLPAGIIIYDLEEARKQYERFFKKYILFFCFIPHLFLYFFWILYFKGNFLAITIWNGRTKKPIYWCSLCCIIRKWTRRRPIHLSKQIGNSLVPCLEDPQMSVKPNGLLWWSQGLTRNHGQRKKTNCCQR